MHLLIDIIKRMAFVDVLYNIVIYPLIQIIEVVYFTVWRIVRNPGISVIAVSFAVTLLCLPLYIVAENLQEKERQKQREMKPHIDRIKSAFSGDERYMILSTYYRQSHYHPMMALRSSIGLLIQVPFFIAAYNFLSNLSSLQGCEFLFIRDLGKPDALFNIGSFTVNILPIAMTAINCIAGAIYTKGLPFRDKLQIYGMAVVFLVLLYNSPSGLVLYWTMNNVLSLVKNIFYKLKRPLFVLYICASVCVLCCDFYLIFLHWGLWRSRLLMACALSLVLLAPLFVKCVDFLLTTVLKSVFLDQKKTFALFIVSASLLCILIGIEIPVSVIVSSPQEFSFIDKYTNPLIFSVITFAKTFGFVIFWPACFYFLFGKKIKTLLAVIFSVVTFGALANVFVFAGDYGTLSAILTFSNANVLTATSQTNLLNFFVLFLLFCAIIVAVMFKQIRPLIIASAFFVVALVGVSVINVSKIQSSYNDYKKMRSEISSSVKELSPIFHLSTTEKNVFVIMLDRAISGYVPYIFDEKKNLAELYDGFVFYPNTVSFAAHTLQAAPPLYGGYEYTPLEINKRDKETLVDKHNEALTVLPRIFIDNDFAVTVTDPSWANYSLVPDLRIYDMYPGVSSFLTINTYTDEWLRQNPETAGKNVRSDLTSRNFLWYSFLRSMPTMFRDVIYNNGNYWNSDKSVQDLQDVISNYAALDFLPQLTDFSAKQNTYTFMVNELTHQSVFLQAPEYVPVSEVTDKGNSIYAEDAQYHTNIASLLRIATWLEYLKKNNAYNNTRIIIVSDHGYDSSIESFRGDFSEQMYPAHFNPILLIKDFDAHGEMKTDMTFMTNADVPSLAISGLVKNNVNPFTQNLIDMHDKENGVAISENTFHTPGLNNRNTFKISDDEWLSVRDNIFDAANWKQEKPQ